MNKQVRGTSQQVTEPGASWSLLDVGANQAVEAGMDWMTMSLEARNLAYNNVAHVGADVTRRKNEGWEAASKAIRAQRPRHLDPAYAPGTGTPEIGGLTTVQGLEIIRGCRGLDVIGGDLVEISPPYDLSGNTSMLGANLLYEMLCILPGVSYRD